jgi:hypothetical protein
MSSENADRAALVDRLDAFTQRLSAGDIAFFFFSGHGVALGGANYVLPSDIPGIEANQEVRLARFALSEHDIVSDLQSRGQGVRGLDQERDWEAVPAAFGSGVGICSAGAHAARRLSTPLVRR